MKGLLLCFVICFVGVFAQQLGPGGSPCKTIYFENIDGGDWTDADNWNWDQGNFQPRTIDDVEIELDWHVTVNLPSSRLVRTLKLARGNTLVIGTGVTLVLQIDALPCYPGNYVDPTDSLCKGCFNLQFQILSDQSFCDNCGDFEMIPNETRESCVCCPPGKYWGGDANAANNVVACPPCPKYQSSYGNCTDCFCCPAGSSSFEGGLCFVCPDPYNSHECGECVLCLPSLRDTNCDCHNNGACITDQTDAFGIVRDLCDCDDTSCGFGPTCNINYDDWQVGPSSPSSYIEFTLPYPFQLVYHSRSLPTGPTLKFEEGVFEIGVNVAVKPLSLDTDWEGCGYINPITNGPPGAEATIFGWDLRVWDPSNNAPVQDNITAPWHIVTPYDNLNVVNPFALHTFYYNTVETKWIDVTYTCTFNKEPTTIQNQQGTVTGPAYQLSAQYHIFVITAEDNFGTFVGTGDGSAVDQGSVFTGNARPPTATTGVTGVVSQPVPVAAPLAPVSAAVNNQNPFAEVENNAVTLIPSIFVALLVIFLF